MLSPIFSESQTGSHKISNVRLWPPRTPGDPGVPWGPQWSSELGRLGGQDGVKQTKVPSPCREGWFCPQILGSQGPAWSQAWPVGVQLTPSPGTQEREGRGGELPAPPPTWTHA